MVSDALISLQNGTIRLADGTLFPDVSFTVRKGEHWAFTGGNEALQNAVLAALAGNASVIYGRIRYPFFESLPPTDPPISPQRLIQAVSFRHPFRTLSNTTDFYYQQRFNSIDADNAQTVQEYLHDINAPAPQPVWTFEKVIAELNLLPLLQKTLIKLSNGETKRVLLAAALLRNPMLLILQNPLAGLDVASRQQIMQLLDSIAASGISLVLSTSPQEIPQTITHVAVFDDAASPTVVLRNDFDATQVVATAVENIDEAEVAALLSLRPAETFRTIIAMHNVSIRYGDVVILDNINWTVQPGERWALTGPNGSGKSTLLSLINGDNPQAFANDIIVFDRQKGSGESIWDIKKKIGFFSPELYQYFPVDTCCLAAVESGFYDTIGLFRPSHAHTAGQAHRWMTLLGVATVAHKLLRHVSPLQQRLCLLARALVKAPPLLLLDEPCQGFDAGEQSHFRQLIESICALSNVTLIYVTHYEAELPPCITHRLQLLAGRQCIKV